MRDDTSMRIEEESGQRSVTGAILTGAAAGSANALVTQAANALKKKPKDGKDKK